MGVNGGVYDFPILEIGDFFGISTDLGINTNSIPHTVNESCAHSLLFKKRYMRGVGSNGNVKISEPS